MTKQIKLLVIEIDFLIFMIKKISKCLNFFFSQIKFLQIFETLLGTIANKEKKKNPKTTVNHKYFLFQNFFDSH